jgi:hypothetical protein
VDGKPLSGAEGDYSFLLVQRDRIQAPDEPAASYRILAKLATLGLRLDFTETRT